MSLQAASARALNKAIVPAVKSGNNDLIAAVKKAVIATQGNDTNMVAFEAVKVTKAGNAVGVALAHDVHAFISVLKGAAESTVSVLKGVGGGLVSALRGVAHAVTGRGM